MEIHGANRYLLHQYFSPNVNQRADGYGGSLENRAGFVIEVAQAVADEIGADRTGIRTSPAFPLGEGDTEAVRAQYRHLVSELANLNPHTCTRTTSAPTTCCALPDVWPTAVLVVRYGRERDGIAADIDADLTDVAPLGRFALANPDIVEQLRTNASFNDLDPATLCTGGANGYTDYSALIHA